MKTDCCPDDGLNRRHRLFPWLYLADKDSLGGLQAPVGPVDRCDDRGEHPLCLRMPEPPMAQQSGGSDTDTSELEVARDNLRRPRVVDHKLDVATALIGIALLRHRHGPRIGTDDSVDL